jgi:predicted RNA binding protein YcfA (HicA-like mRNA interferase family)
LKKYTVVPAITGEQLIKLLQKNGWELGRPTAHGKALKKRINDRTLVTWVDDTTESLPTKTLGQILSVKQTCLGKKGLLELLNKYGLK